MTLRVGETGKTFRANAGFDMSSNTNLTLTFTNPNGTVITKTKAASQVTLGTSSITDADLGALVANKYAEYEIEDGFLAVAGKWSGYLTYTNTASTPDDVFIGATFRFTVLDPAA